MIKPTSGTNITVLNIIIIHLCYKEIDIVPHHVHAEQVRMVSYMCKLTLCVPTNSS